MIESFKHKGLKRLFEKGDRKLLNPQHVEKIENILTVLDAADTIEGVDLPGYRLHALTGDLKGFGRLRCAPIGESYSASKAAMHWTSISSTTINGR